VLEHFGDRATLLQVELETGRTHQIRLHCAGRGYPVLGDRRYGSPSDLKPPRMALHARLLAFDHPTTGEALRFESPLPPVLEAWLGTLRSA
jgi:23S rRNA pseudouridine1911/1915/1917 synthase